MLGQRLERQRCGSHSRRLLATLIAASSWLVTTSAAAAVNVWSPVSESTITVAGERYIIPDAYATFEANLSQLRAQLEQAPLEGEGAWAAAIELSLPLPDGSTSRFHVVESPIMAPELAARYPEIRTYLGQGIDDRTATVRFDLVPRGFHAMIISASGTVMIDPYQRGDVQNYVVYHKYHARRNSDPAPAPCILKATEAEIRAAEAFTGETTLIANGDELRTYRIAVAATGEYTVFHGGTVANGMAAIVVAMNRVNGIYEREVAVRMNLIPNNDLIVYTNGATDPYSNNNGGAMLGQNQANLDAVIGSANYDIGHVFSTGGGGVAFLGVVCVTGSKARGVTGLSAPIGDVFYVDYVAHEMGHQSNATHTFNGNAGGCNGNRTATSAYEPGSGSTILAYAGLCGSQNIQFRSDDYFHTKSFDQIVLFTNNQAGNSCAATTSTGNTPPVPDATQAVTFDAIPISTPFTLTGSATDADGDELTYCWEEYDLGPAGHPNAPVGTAPIFRSFLATTSPSRTFPQWSDIVNNTQTTGEILPTYSRFLRFRLTARDNRAGGGGVDWDITSFDVDDAAGPFLLTVPNTNVVWSSTVTHDVIWDVASTNNLTVNCQTVDILLSIDGGYTYPMVLVAGTPNDGSETVTLPDINTPDARIMVAAADNVFFDISDVNFEITTTVAVGDPVADVVNGLRILGNRPNPFNPITHISFSVPQAGHTTLRLYDASGRIVAMLADGFIEAGVHTRSWDGRDRDGHPVASGVYYSVLEGAGGEVAARRVVLTK